jgi:hypothetical protein
MYGQALIDGRPVERGELLIDFRGTPWAYDAVSSRRKILVRAADDDSTSPRNMREFNVQVFPGLALDGDDGNV